MSTAVYVRVSTKEQRHDSQELALERYLAGQDLGEIVWFRDKATGKDVQRPGFQRMLGAVASRTVQTVVVWKLDRAFRNALDCLRTVEEWDRFGVALRIVDLGGQPIDTKSAAGKFMLTVVAAVAEMETANRRERQLAGIEAVKRKNGGKVTWGGSAAGRRLRRTEAKERTMVELAAKGWGPVEIAGAVGLSRWSVWRFLNGRTHDEHNK